MDKFTFIACFFLFLSSSFQHFVSWHFCQTPLADTVLTKCSIPSPLSGVSWYLNAPLNEIPGQMLKVIQCLMWVLTCQTWDKSWHFRTPLIWSLPKSQLIALVRQRHSQTGSNLGSVDSQAGVLTTTPHSKIIATTENLKIKNWKTMYKESEE